jgi:phage terminase large subunit GpA-like protein
VSDFIYTEGFKEGIKPDPILKVSEWSEKYRQLSSKSSAEPGPWRNSRTPFLVEIMDCLSAHSPVSDITFMKGSQIGGSEAGVNWIGYSIHSAPGPMMMVQPSIDMLKRATRQRLNPLIEETPELKMLVASNKSRGSGNTLFEKEFQGGILVMATANSSSALRSMPVGKLFMDEVDAFPLDVDGEGSPVELAKARTRTFKRKKILKVSTPTLKGLSVIESEFEQGDQRFYMIPCPFCDHYQKLVFKNLKWEKADYESVRYYCEECGEAIDEHHKTKMFSRGKWVPTARSSNKNRRSYHLSALYSPYGMFSWQDIAEDWEKAQGNEPKLITFINTVLGETWEIKGDAPKWRRLYERREDYKLKIVPMGGCILTMGVDVQKDRLEAHVMAWGKNAQKWTVDYAIIEGDTSNLNVDGPWNKLAEIIATEYKHESGAMLPLKKIAIDSGYNTSTVYQFVQKYPANRVMAIKGRDNQALVIGTPSVAEVKQSGKRSRHGIKVWPIGVSMIKSEVYGWLKIDRPTDEELELHGWPYGYMHIPQMGEDFFKQLTAEQLVKRKNRNSGYTTHVWEKKFERNEVLDTTVYNRACASLLHIDRFTPQKWDSIQPGGEVTPTVKQIEAKLPMQGKKRQVVKRREVDNGL